MEKIYFELTESQKKAFDKLKAAYKACEKAGIYFVNVYGDLHAYDKSIVADYADDSSLDEDDDNIIRAKDSYCLNTLKIVNEWTDDSHLIKLTAKGLKKLEKDEL